MGKKRLSVFKTFLALMSNQNGNIRMGFAPRFLLDEGGEGGGGTGAEGGEGTPEPKPDQSGTYPKEFVEKLLREKNNWRTKAQELETKIKETPAPKEPTGGDDEVKAMLKAEREKREALEARLKTEEDFKKNAMKLGAIKKEFSINGGDDKAFALITKLVETDKVMIDEDSGVVYGAEAELKRIKEMAPQLFGKPKKGTDQDDKKPYVDPSESGGLLDGKRNKKDKETGNHPLVDFYATHGITLKK